MKKQTVTWFRQQLQRFGLEAMNRYYGMYRAFVVDNNDPEKCGRLKLEIPQIYGKEIHDYWAWSFGMSAGTNVGFFAVPNVGDMVWVAFENGDPAYPIWSYGHFAQNDLMEKAKSDYPQKKVFRTTSGNQITSDDKNKKLEFEQAAGTAIDIQKKKINLGTLGNAAQPAILGDDCVTKLQAICDKIMAICDKAAQIKVPTPVGLSGVPINAADFQTIKSDVGQIKSDLPTIKSKVVRLD